MNPNEVITKDSERAKSFFRSLDRMLDRIERLASASKPSLNGERYLTDREVSARLKVSRRTLQDHRTNGQIPYIQFGGKCLYRESDIQKLLEKSYRKAWEQP